MNRYNDFMNGCSGQNEIKIIFLLAEINRRQMLN